MEARSIRLAVAAVIACACSSRASAQIMVQATREFVAHSDNFIVFASSPQWAAQVAQVAERHRRELALHWLGKELPNWPQRCPVHVQAAPGLAAQGETRYSLLPQGTAGNWQMSVTGTPERVVDSVLPHEITHTIFASHFAPLGKYVPRWADEGACTTVESEMEKSKHREHLIRFLKTGRGLAFNTMFRLKEYPHDILPLYAQGHSAVQFLIDQGGPQKFVKFIEAGMQSDDWARRLKEYYAYESIGEFQTLWNSWLAAGSPVELSAYAPALRQPAGSSETLLASATDQLDQSQPGDQRTAGNRSPDSISLASASPPTASSEWTGLPIQASDPVALQAAVPSTDQRVGAGTASDEGWYSRRLREVSGQPATPVPEHNTVAKNFYVQEPAFRGLPNAISPAPDSRQGQTFPQSAARPMPAESPGIQVLDWGAGGPVPGIQPSGYY